MTSAELHEKKSEPSIQRKLAATQAAQPYILPPILEAEAYITAILLCNIVTMAITGTLTHTKSSPRKSRRFQPMYLEF